MANLYRLRTDYFFSCWVFLHAFLSVEFSNKLTKNVKEGQDCLILILYVPSTIFQLYRDGFSWVESDKCVSVVNNSAGRLLKSKGKYS